MSAVPFYQSFAYLHPTMYLLIQIAIALAINCIENLHPTMYLLIRIIYTMPMDIRLYLHPTMYLLIQKL